MHLNRGKSEWEKAVSVACPDYLMESDFTSYNTLKGDINVAVIFQKGGYNVRKYCSVALGETA